MADEIGYLVGRKINHLYTDPSRNEKGAYATLIGDSEHPVAEIDVTPRCKIAISAFYVRDQADFSTFKITKLQYHARHGWRENGHLQVNQFQIAQMKEFVAILSSLDLRDAKKNRISLENIQFGALSTLLSSTKGTALVKELATSPDLHHDIYAVAAKRAALADFKANLDATLSESAWQSFFEQNPWIFGHGLNYIFLNKAGKKLESVTTGSTYDRPGKRTDGLMLTRAEISQYVLVEIKTNDTDLLQEIRQYRPGCWGVSRELSNAVTQIQKTAFEFSRERFREHLKDEHGNDTGKTAYVIEPRSYLVIGNLSQLLGNEDKIACFELYRRNIRAPEILTFDELYHRASCIVENISREASEPDVLTPATEDDDIPF